MAKITFDFTEREQALRAHAERTRAERPFLIMAHNVDRPRFFQKVRRGQACHLWTAGKNRKGYGTFSVSGIMRMAHRAAYAIAFGRAPAGVLVLHQCDNPGCVNPDHLFLGTNDKNMADMAAKGRANRPRGETNPNARLTERQVREIRDSRRSRSEIASQYGITQPMVSQIRLRRAWVCVP